MEIIMEVVSDASLSQSIPAHLLLTSFAYADTGSVDDHEITKPSHLSRTWESSYGRVSVLGSMYAGTFDIAMSVDSMCGTPLVARALGVFEYFMHDSDVEVGRIRITDSFKGINEGMQDLSADSLCKLIFPLPVSNPEEWWDNNVLPALEKIWE